MARLNRDPLAKRAGAVLLSSGREHMWGWFRRNERG
jgi:hypothetical protein